MISVATLMTWASLSLMPLPATINVEQGSCPFPGYANAVGCAASYGQKIYVDTAYFERANDMQAARTVMLHEVGHLFDYQVMTPRARMLFRFFIQDRRPWAKGPNPPKEKFASAYAFCALYDRPPHDSDIYDAGYWLGEYGLVMSDRMKRNVCLLVIATSRGLL